MAIDVRATRMDSVREEALVADARAGSAAAVGYLYDFYLPRIYGFIGRRVEGRDVAEDLTAATFERVLGAALREDFRNVSFGGFLYRVAATAVVDHARRSRRTIPKGVRASDLDQNPSDRRTAEAIGDGAAARAFAAAIDRDTLRRALLRVPDVQRGVLVLKYFDGLDTEELCAVLRCSRRTLTVKLHRALRALLAEIEQEAMHAA